MLETLYAHDLKPEYFDVLGDRYLVKPIKIDERTASGISLVNAEQARNWDAGYIVRVGNGHSLDKEEVVTMAYQVGDLITWEQLTGREYCLGGIVYKIIPQTSVLAKFNAAALLESK